MKFQVAQLVWSAYVNVTDRRTDGEKDIIFWQYPPMLMHGSCIKRRKIFTRSVSACRQHLLDERPDHNNRIK